jgi:hypothetical protein
MNRRIALGALAAFAAWWAALGLPGCSSAGSGGGPAADAAIDQATDTTSAEGALRGDAPQTSDSGPDSPSEPFDAPGPEAGDTGPDAPDASETGPTCTPIDASVDGASSAAGQTLVGNHECYVCHNDDLAGGISISGAYSKNLTPDPGTGLGCWTDPQIVTAILYGTTPDGQTLCVMPQWGTSGYRGMVLSPDQAEDIVQYLRTLPPVSKVVLDTVCPEAGLPTDAGPDAGPDANDDGPSEAGADGGDAASE